MHGDAPDARTPRRYGHRVPTFIRVLLALLSVPAIGSCMLVARVFSDARVNPPGPEGACANGLFAALFLFLIFGAPWLVAVIALAIFDGD